MTVTHSSVVYCSKAEQRESTRQHHNYPWAPAGIFVGGSEPQKGPPQDEKAPPPPKKKKNCASTVLRGLGGMLSREKINSGAPYYILDASQHERI